MVLYSRATASEKCYVNGNRNGVSGRDDIQTIVYAGAQPNDDTYRRVVRGHTTPLCYLRACCCDGFGRCSMYHMKSRRDRRVGRVGGRGRRVVIVETWNAGEEREEIPLQNGRTRRNRGKFGQQHNTTRTHARTVDKTSFFAILFIPSGHGRNANVTVAGSAGGRARIVSSASHDGGKTTVFFFFVAITLYHSLPLSLPRTLSLFLTLSFTLSLTHSLSLNLSALVLTPAAVYGLTDHRRRARGYSLISYSSRFRLNENVPGALNGVVRHGYVFYNYLLFQTRSETIKKRK